MDSKKRFRLLLVAMLALFAAPCFGFISGTVIDTDGKAVSGASVTFTDESNTAHSLSAVTDGNGKYQIDVATSVNDAFGATATPEPFSLGQNYPNPFNPTTTIPFVLNKAGNVKIEIFTITGQRIRSLINEYRSPGIQSVLWDALDDKGAHVSAGVYLYRLQADGRSESKKMLLLDGGPGASSTSGGSASMPTMGKSAITPFTTWSVEIKADGIITYTESHLVFTDGNTFNFVVTRLSVTITFVSIPGGTFQMGDVENAGSFDEKPVHSVTVSGFEMGVNEITNAQYAQFLNDANASGDITATSSSVTGAKGAYSGQAFIYLLDSYDANNKCWITYNNGTFASASGKENWPVVSVTWYGSKAFALYYGLDLPTEAEWEYACRGGKQYKYGTDDGTISTSKVNYWDNGIHHPVTVGSYAANPYGLRDMSGNVWEWCHDWYADYTSSSQNNPSGEQTGSRRVCHGGGWAGDGSLCRSARRGGGIPGSGYGYVGFRVVRRVSPQNY